MPRHNSETSNPVSPKILYFIVVRLIGEKLYFFALIDLRLGSGSMYYPGPVSK